MLLSKKMQLIMNLRVCVVSLSTLHVSTPYISLIGLALNFLIYFALCVSRITLINEYNGATPDLIYAKGFVPNTPSPDPNAFDCKQGNLTIMEIGF